MTKQELAKELRDSVEEVQLQIERTQGAIEYVRRYGISGDWWHIRMHEKQFELIGALVKALETALKYISATR